MGRT
jgi:hypothetical protein